MLKGAIHLNVGWLCAIWASYMGQTPNRLTKGIIFYKIVDISIDPDTPLPLCIATS